MKYCMPAILVLSLFLASCSDKLEAGNKDQGKAERTYSMNATYPDNFDQVSERCNEVGFDKLSGQEKLVYCIWWLEGEINNGGFHQFFTNSAGDYTNETLEALDAIGALKTKKLLETAVALSFNGEPAPSDRATRNDLLERPTVEAEEELFTDLNELDQEFLKYEDPITDLVNKWISEQK